MAEAEPENVNCHIWLAVHERILGVKAYQSACAHPTPQVIAMSAENAHILPILFGRLSMVNYGFK